MKVKYISDDGHEFPSEEMCLQYEEGLKEIKVRNVLLFSMADEKEWYRITDPIDLYLFDHMNENSKNTFYDVLNYSQKIKFPFSITNSNSDDSPLLEDYIKYQKIVASELEKQLSSINKKIDDLEKINNSTPQMEVNINTNEKIPIDMPNQEHEVDFYDQLVTDIRDIESAEKNKPDSDEKTVSDDINVELSDEVEFGEK